MDEVLKLDFLTEINYLRLFIDLIILFICSKAIEYVYNKYGYSNDNKLLFTNHMFPYLISMFLIVSVIKTSIALSLGLVGALSIIRFRTAIKEPGQLITLLILTSLAISMAAEKELLGIIVTIIYCVHSMYKLDAQHKDSFVYSHKILRVSMNNNIKNVDDVIATKNFERIYEDTDKNLIVEFSLTSGEDKFKSILDTLNKIGVVNSYEVF